LKRGIKIKQRDITDCGAACLASIATYYNSSIPVSRIRQYSGTDKQGTNVLGLIEAAERLGFQAKGAKGPLESLSKIPLPAIAHVSFTNGLQHYVVIYKVTKKYVTIMDPADGKIYNKKIEEFSVEWTGVVVLLLPSDGFIIRSEKVSNYSRFWQLMRPHSSIMTQALVGAVIYTLLGLSTSIYMQKIIDFVLVDGNLQLLNLLSVGMVVILVLKLFIGTFKSILGLQTGQYIDARLILGYYKHLLNLPQRFFDTMRVGEIVSRVNDAVKIRIFVNDIVLNIIVNILITFFSIGLMFFYYWKLALIMLAIIPFYLFLYVIVNRINKKWQRSLMENSAELEVQLVESLNAANTIKQFGLEEYSNLKTENRFIVLLQAIYKSSIKGLYLGTSAEFITSLFTIIILWAGSYFVINRELTPGELLSFYALIGYFTGPVSSLLNSNRSIQDALIAADRLFEIIDLETESDNNKVELNPEMVGDIDFNNVSFRYGTRTTVFEAFTVTFRKNTTTAVVGESGSGKSTILALIQNLYPLQDGNITIGGIDIKHIGKKNLRQIVSVVPQKIDLFAGSIIENIAIGDYDPDLQRILHLSKMLGISDFVEKMPTGYHTILHEQGVNLSGGQRQRIAIARALYRQPEVLILDEATSALDADSEKKVQATLAAFRKSGKTLIIIAHRLSTVKQADRIIVLKSGKVVEEGSHTELLHTKGVYAKMWDTLRSEDDIS